jgi:very-short-patch-repair endonuclease
LPELQRFVWQWPSLLDRVRELNPSVGDPLARACRPIEAQRRPDGRLLLVLGCWVPADRATLANPVLTHLLERALKQVVEERIEVLLAEWPGGDGPPDQAPDPLADLPEGLRAIGLTCGGALKRSFFAAMARRGIVFECLYPVLNYRLDFALPRKRVGIEIEGWDWRTWTRPGAIDRREREQSLGYEGWTILWFTGEEVLHHLGRVADEVAQEVS